MQRVIAPLLLALGAGLAGASSDPQTVLKAIVDNQRGGSVRATLSLSVVRPDRQTQYVLNIVSDGAERALIRVKAPPREAGQSFLRVGDNLQIYNPALKRVLRLPPSGRSEGFLGSDLSYSDLTGRDLERDFTPKISSEDAEGLTLELTPRPDAPTPYGKVTIRARVKGFVPTEVSFFDQRNQAVKRVSFARFVEVGGRTFPLETTVDDLLRAGSRTVLVYSDYAFGASIPGACFTERALEAGC